MTQLVDKIEIRISMPCLLYKIAWYAAEGAEGQTQTDKHDILNFLLYVKNA